MDDIKLYGDDSDYWKIVSLPDDLSSEYGWRNSRILKAISPGLGELTASLTYFNGHHDSKEVRALYFVSLKTFFPLSICCYCEFNSFFSGRFSRLSKKLWSVKKCSSN